MPQQEPFPGSSGRDNTRFAMLAAVVDAEAVRSGEPIGYQNTLVDVLRCLDEGERGLMTARECADRIYEHIADAVMLDSVEPESIDPPAITRDATERTRSS